MKLENDFFWAEIDGRTGGLGSFVLKRDPDRMNWVEGREVWGGVRALTGMEEPEPVSFVSLEKQGHAVVSHYENEELRISVTRSLSPAGGLREEYAISGKNRVPLFFNRGDLGIYATFNDSYAAAATCVKQRCHAHIWCGGAVSFIRALKMGFSDWNVGLILREGALDSYSVERPAAEISNDRGDFLLHPVPTVIEPGETRRIVWELFAFPEDRFEETLLENYSGVVLIENRNDTVFPGEKFELSVRSSDEIREAEVRVDDMAIPCRFLGKRAETEFFPERNGEYEFHFRINGVETIARCRRVAAPDNILKKRIDFIVRHQQYRKPGSPLDGAFLIYDNEEKRPYFQANVGDHNAGRERLGMGLLIARYLLHREMLLEMHAGAGSNVLGDKGYICNKTMKAEFSALGISLHPPLRSNMKDDRPPERVKTLNNQRRLIETVIAQLTERFNAEKIRARDLWHLTVRIGRKLLAHSINCCINQKNGNPLLQFEQIFC